MVEDSAPKNEDDADNDFKTTSNALLIYKSWTGNYSKLSFKQIHASNRIRHKSSPLNPQHTHIGTRLHNEHKYYSIKNKLEHLMIDNTDNNDTITHILDN